MGNLNKIRRRPHSPFKQKLPFKFFFVLSLVRSCRLLFVFTTNTFSFSCLFVVLWSCCCGQSKNQHFEFVRSQSLSKRHLKTLTVGSTVIKFSLLLYLNSFLFFIPNQQFLPNCSVNYN